MNREKLNRMSGEVRIGGKGSMRRKKKVVPTYPVAYDEKKIQMELKKQKAFLLTDIDEAWIFHEDGSTLHFVNPRVQGNSTANYLVISGQPFSDLASRVDPAISGAPIRRANPPPEDSSSEEEDGIPDLTNVRFDVGIADDPAIQEVGPEEGKVKKGFTQDSLILLDSSVDSPLPRPSSSSSEATLSSADLESNASPPTEASADMAEAEEGPEGAGKEEPTLAENNAGDGNDDDEDDDLTICAAIERQAVKAAA